MKPMTPMNSAEPRVCVLTGAASGIGRAAALQLAQHDVQLVLVDRNLPGLNEVAAEIETAGHAAPRLHGADLSTTGGVRELADRLRADHPRIDVLANNAGVLCEKRVTTAEGLELTFAVNYLAPFLLTQRLRSALEASDDARVINTSSLAHGHGKIHFDDPQLDHNWHFYRAYAQSKLAIMLFTRALSRRTEGTRITTNCFHPGVVNTGIGEQGIMTRIMRIAGPLIRTPETGAASLVYLATSPDVQHTRGEYFIDSRVRKPKRRGRDDEAAERLWEQTEALLQTLSAS